ncbi:hypothetical protein [uncultured Methanobrevibacter sp.]|nr:hypothetical protein [uncultured Methanobrevibacter sp.]
MFLNYIPCSLLCNNLGTLIISNVFIVKIRPIVLIDFRIRI